MITRKQLIKKFIDFYKSKDHKEIPNASLVPENDPTTLFVGSGMETIVPYLLGQKHPLGKRLTNNQKCIRTIDIGEVGDTFHHTFFEMLGNWSLGDYWKEEAIKMTYEFVTEVLGVPKEKLAATCFKGDNNSSKDLESEKVYLHLGFPKERIAFLGKEDNFWGPVGKTGPCGPNTEIFYWKLNNKPAPKIFNPEDENWLEIGNNVLMTYNKNEKGKFEKQKQRNIDFGGGVERIITTLNGLEDNYLSDSFKSIIEKIEKLSKKKYGEAQKGTKAMRIIADHIKASVFIIADGVIPSNTEQGYVLRKLIRRAIRYGHILRIKNFTKKIAEPVFKIYDDYGHLQKNKKKILEELEKEEIKFEQALERSMRITKEIIDKKIPIKEEKFSKFMQMGDKMINILKILWERKRDGKNYQIKEVGISEKEIDKATITGKEAFYLYQSFGLPVEMILDLAIEKNLFVHRAGFREELKKHQKLSKTASAGKFKSGLADNSELTTKLHTTTHLLLAALRTVLKDKNILQKGSNITPERLRLDFSFPRKLEKQEIQEVEELVNKQIQKNQEITKEEMSPDKAKAQGALGVFDAKYPDIVSVYTVGDFSKEICAGPHITNTSELGKFKIKKEGSSSAGVRRIKGVLE